MSLSPQSPTKFHVLPNLKKSMFFLTSSIRWLSRRW